MSGRSAETSRVQKDKFTYGLVTPREHGAISTYANYGCRCVECKTAAQEYYRIYRQARRAAGHKDGSGQKVAK